MADPKKVHKQFMDKCLHKTLRKQHKTKDQGIAECMQMWRDKGHKADMISLSDSLKCLTACLINGGIDKTAFIKKLKGKWHVMSEKGKSMGEYATKGEAVKRLRQIEYFKHNK